MANMRIIGFNDRTAELRRIRLGYEGDNLVERLEFMLPEIAQSQTATLLITGADAVKLDRTDGGRYAVDLTRDMVGPDGEREAYVRVDGAGGQVWQSAPMRLITGALPDVEEEIEKIYPTAVGQMLMAMAEHSGEMAAQEERIEQEADRAERAADALNDPYVVVRTLVPEGEASAEWTVVNGKPTLTLNVPRGKPGDKGDKGDRGDRGYTPVKGVDYTDGVGIDDIAVERLINPNNRDEWKVTFKTTDGRETSYVVTDGKNGYTPIKGIDYTDGAPGPGITDLTITERTDAAGKRYHQVVIMWEEALNGSIINAGQSFNVYDGTDGEPGKSGVHYGPDEPTDPEVNVWINPEGEGDPVLQQNAHLLEVAYPDVSARYTYAWQYKLPNEPQKWRDSTSTGAQTNALVLNAKTYQDGYQYRCNVYADGALVAQSPIATLHIVNEVTASTATLQTAVHGDLLCTISNAHIYSTNGQTHTIAVTMRKAETFGSAVSSFCGNFAALYKTPELDGVQAGAEFDLAASTIDDIYARFDAIALEHPDAMTKNLLGYGSDANGAADESLPIYEYVINSRSTALYDGSSIPAMPVVLIASGVHAGREKAAVWSVYQMVKAMFASEASDCLLDIMANVELRIVPIVNPWAYNTGARTNARGVNINRNFSVGWENANQDAASTEYRGPAIYSELETQAIRKWMIDHSDALLLIDCHNCFAENEYAYGQSFDSASRNTYTTYTRRMSEYLARRYGLNSGKNFFRDAGGNFTPVLALEAGIVGITRHVLIESNAYGLADRVMYGRQAIQLGVDALVNFLLAMLNAEA